MAKISDQTANLETLEEAENTDQRATPAGTQ